MPLLGPRFTAALGVVARMNAGLVRKGSAIPYISHLLGVASIALEYGATEDEAIAALLHDAIEDPPADLGAAGARREIVDTFGADVLAIIEGCTDADSVLKAPRLTRKKRYTPHPAYASPSVVLVAASDKLHNVHTMISYFPDLVDSLWSRFNKDAGKAGTVWYYRGVVSAFQRTGHHPRLIRDLDIAVYVLEDVAGHPASSDARPAPSQQHRVLAWPTR